MAYKTELEARLHYVASLLRYTGTKEGSQSHSEILSNYNRITPLPRGHKATKTDSWCAIFVNGGAWSLGYRNFPWECSCTRIRAKAKSVGIWNEGWTSTQKVGQWVIYDWKNDGAVDHIGVVCWISGNRIYVLEGNYDDSVKIRVITVGDTSVEGFVDLDFAELVDDSTTDTVGVLCFGDVRPEVKLVQSVLKGAGYYVGEIDGSYGTRTKDAVIEFQSCNGLDPDGKAGPKTMGVITSGKFTVKRAESPKIETELKEEDIAMKVYDTIDQLPAWAKEAVSELVDMEIVNGVGVDRLGLDDTSVRIAVMLYRGMKYISDRCGVALK